MNNMHQHIMIHIHNRVNVRQSVLMLLLAECVILVVGQKVRLGFLNVRSDVRTLPAFNIKH